MNHIDKLFKINAVTFHEKNWHCHFQFHWDLNKISSASFYVRLLTHTIYTAGLVKMCLFIYPKCCYCSKNRSLFSMIYKGAALPKRSTFCKKL